MSWWCTNLSSRVFPTKEQKNPHWNSRMTFFPLNNVFNLFLERNSHILDHYIKHLLRTRGKDCCKTLTLTHFCLLTCPSAKTFFLDYYCFNSNPCCRIIPKINLCSPRLVLLLSSLEAVFPSNQHPCTGSSCTFFTVSWEWKKNLIYSINRFWQQKWPRRQTNKLGKAVHIVSIKPKWEGWHSGSLLRKS